MIDLLRRLCSAPGVSGDEQTVAQVICNEFAPYANHVGIDQNGNVIAEMGNTEAERHILLDAHLDQIGLIVTKIDKQGFLRIAPCGGVDRRVLMGARVLVCGTRQITGVISCLPPHLIKGGEDQVPLIDQLAVDTGFSKSEIENIVKPGDRVLFDTSLKVLIGKRVSAPGLDNRAGVASLIRCAELLSKKKFYDKISFVCSVQEETGGTGAKTASYSLDPVEAIMVDVSYAEQPEVSSEKSGKMGEGPMIGISPTLSKTVFNSLIQTAQENRIPYQLEVMGGNTGTNADEVTNTRRGIPSGLISIPLRNMHTQAEVIDWQDIEDTAQLLASYVENGGNFHA